MNYILASIWRKIATEALKAFVVTGATVIATKGVEHIYDTRFKPKKEKKPEPAAPDKKPAKGKPKAKPRPKK